MQYESVFSERTNKITSKISTSFVLFLMHVLAVCYAFTRSCFHPRLVVFIVVRITFIYFNQTFGFNNGRINLAEFNRFSSDQAFGFCDKLVFEK